MTILTKILSAVILGLIIWVGLLSHRITGLRSDLKDCQHAAQVAKVSAEGVSTTLAILREQQQRDSLASVEREQRIEELTRELGNRTKWPPRPVTAEGVKERIMETVNTK